MQFLDNKRAPHGVVCLFTCIALHCVGQGFKHNQAVSTPAIQTFDEDFAIQDTVQSLGMPLSGVLAPGTPGEEAEPSLGRI